MSSYDTPYTADDPIVGVVCDSHPDGDMVHATLTDRDATVVSGPIEEVLDSRPSLLVAIGSSGLTAVAQQAVDVPVLPIGSVSGIETVEAERLDDAIEAVANGEAIDRRVPLLAVECTAASGNTDRYRALFDVTLVTAEPARISEYSVESRGTAIDQFRADGVVVATPAGSYGYASGVDAPQLSGAVDAVAVVPIAPFVTTTRRWVLPDDDLELSVKRDDGPISLLADDRTVETIGPTDRVTVGVDGAITTLTTPESRR